MAKGALQLKDPYVVGTLRYTKKTLLYMFAWMLWGDFCFTLSERVLPAILPLYLKELNASNTAMSILMTTLPCALGAVVCPIVSYKSDRTRTRWGRRMPYIIFTAPFLAAFLALIGFSTELTAYMQGLGIVQALSAHPTTVAIVVLGVLIFFFNLFNDFVNSVYWYLFADVVPEAFLGRFLSLFRMVSIVAGALFSKYVFPHSLTHMKWIFLGAAVLYLFGFTLMCFMVKEGQYPPVPETAGDQKPFLASCWHSTRTFFSESFSHRFFVYLYLFNCFWYIGKSCAPFLVLYTTKTLDISLEQLGNAQFWAAIGTFAISFPVGWFIDRVHPVNAMVWSGILVIPIAAGTFFFCNDFYSWIIWQNLLFHPLNQIHEGAMAPISVHMLPKEKYGQFASAQATLRMLTGLIASVVIGAMFDVLAKKYGNDCYRWAFLWMTVTWSISMFFLVLVVVHWRKLGGKENFTPPLPETAVPAPRPQEQKTSGRLGRPISVRAPAVGT